MATYYFEGTFIAHASGEFEADSEEEAREIAKDEVTDPFNWTDDFVDDVIVFKEDDDA